MLNALVVDCKYLIVNHYIIQRPLYLFSFRFFCMFFLTEIYTTMTFDCISPIIHRTKL